jgi:hypothetical protein
VLALWVQEGALLCPDKDGGGRGLHHVVKDLNTPIPVDQLSSVCEICILAKQPGGGAGDYELWLALTIYTKNPGDRKL